MKHINKTFILRMVSIVAAVVLIFMAIPLYESAIKIQKFVDEAGDGNVVWLCEREYVDVSDETHLNYHEWQPVRYYGLTQGTELGLICTGAWVVPTIMLCVAVWQTTYMLVIGVYYIKKTLNKKKEERA